MSNYRPAGFWIRTLASFLDVAILWMPLTLLVLYVSGAPNLADLIYRALLGIIIWWVPGAFFTTLVYGPWFISKTGATLGKYFSGLKVTNDDGQNLTYKRAFFRQNIGYTFSGSLFGLGFLAIAKDPEKLGWHDKATGSRVWVVRTLWPLALLVLTVLLAIQGYFWSQTIKQITTSPIAKEVTQLFRTAPPEKTYPVPSYPIQ
ncbi:MAG: RDD family protein [Candidatus Blackburnbacteria bacterium]|nr:RDD family protein [Candidatus Blackburnbacteria bacterium]